MAESSTPTMSTSVEVEADPATAFSVFTEEFDQWWGNGPIDAWDSTRVVGRRFEPGVGGRLLEIYPDDSLELGRVIAWEPPARLAWASSVDDVVIEVTFEPVGGGRTRVQVVGTATGPNANEGFSFVRMTPQWLPRHLARRAEGHPHAPPGRLNIVVRYREPAATARWLAEVFGFEPTGDLPHEEPADPDHTWFELRMGDGSAAVFVWPLPPGGTVDGGDHLPWVYVDDLDAHLARTTAAAATIVSPVVHHGFRSYTAADREGRHWLFAQAPPHLTS